MLKQYEKPKLIKESLSCSSCLCSCAAMANVTESLQCGYALVGTPYTIFVNGWANCMMSNELLPDQFKEYCYQSGATNVFSS